MGIEGECSLCEQFRTLKSYEDRQVCTSCLIILGAAKNRPHQVISALQQYGNMPDAPGELDSVITKHNSLAARLADISQALGCAPDEDVLEVAKAIAATKDQDHSEEVADLHAKCEQLKRELQKAREVATKATNARDVARSALQEHIERQGRVLPMDDAQEIAWLLAEGMLEGKITGVSTEIVRRLRGMQG